MVRWVDFEECWRGKNFLILEKDSIGSLVVGEMDLRKRKYTRERFALMAAILVVLSLVH
jgi:hypothetical protein